MSLNKFFSKVPMWRATASLVVAMMVSTPGNAASLEYAGVFGNSGEEGDSLVRFAPGVAAGMGVFYDGKGSLYDRGGDGRLNRYTLDGRLLDSWTLPKRNPRRGSLDVLLADGDSFLLYIGKKFYRLDHDNPRDEAPTPFPDIEADYVSYNIHRGFAVATHKQEVFRINAEGVTESVTTMDEKVPTYGVGQGPEGEVYVILQGHRLARVDPQAPEDGRGPFGQIGNPIQWLNGYWYGGAGHGTLYRISRDLKHDPGVVLGGNSGSFLGYLPGNYEFDHPCGIEAIGGDLFAFSGRNGVVHLAQWQPANQRFELVRRIGSVFSCEALSLDDKGQLWWGAGSWAWDDAPDTPMRHGFGAAHEWRYAGGNLLKGQILVAPAVRHGKPSLIVGNLSGPPRFFAYGGTVPNHITISALLEKTHEVLAFTSKGKGVRIQIDSKGEPKKFLGEVALVAREPVTAWSSLAVIGERLLGTADGFIIEMARNDTQWEEVERWNTWGKSPQDRFGERIFAFHHNGRLWVADTLRHRVLCFDAESRKLLASFGAMDKAGTDTVSLDQPTIITANGDRAVVYDSENQRLIKLEFKP